MHNNQPLKCENCQRRRSFVLKLEQPLHSKNNSKTRKDQHQFVNKLNNSKTVDDNKVISDEKIIHQWQLIPQRILTVVDNRQDADDDMENDTDSDDNVPLSHLFKH